MGCGASVARGESGSSGDEGDAEKSAKASGRAAVALPLPPLCTVPEKALGAVAPPAGELAKEPAKPSKAAGGGGAAAGEPGLKAYFAEEYGGGDPGSFPADWEFCADAHPLLPTWRHRPTGVHVACDALDLRGADGSPRPSASHPAAGAPPPLPMPRRRSRRASRGATAAAAPDWSVVFHYITEEDVSPEEFARGSDQDVAKRFQQHAFPSGAGVFLSSSDPGALSDKRRCGAEMCIPFLVRHERLLKLPSKQKRDAPQWADCVLPSPGWPGTGGGRAHRSAASRLEDRLARCRRRAARLREARGEADEAAVAASLQEAAALELSGDSAEGERVLRSALAACDAASSPRSGARCLEQLVALLYNRCRGSGVDGQRGLYCTTAGAASVDSEDLEALARRLLEDQEAALGPAPGAALLTLRRMAVLLAVPCGALPCKRRAAALEAVLRRAAARCEEAFGASDARALRASERLAVHLRRRGGLGEAEGLHRAVLERRQASLKPAHPDILASMNNLGVVLKAAGKLEEAERLLRSACSAGEAVGPAACSSAASQGHVVAVLRAAGRLRRARVAKGAAAEKEARPSLQEKAVGPAPRASVASRGNLAAVLRASGRLDEASMVAKGVASDKEAAFGLAHPSTRLALNNLAVLRRQTGDLEEADALLRRATLHTNDMGTPPLQTDEEVATLCNLASLSLAMERTDEAEARYRRILTSDGPGDRPELAAAAAGLGLALWRRGSSGEAVPLLRRALACRERLFGPDHPCSLASRAGLALVLDRPEDEEEAVGLLQRCLAACADGVLAPGHPAMAAVLSHAAAFVRSRLARESAGPMLSRVAERLAEAARGPAAAAAAATARAPARGLARRLLAGGQHWRSAARALRTELQGLCDELPADDRAELRHALGRAGDLLGTLAAGPGDGPPRRGAAAAGDGVTAAGVPGGSADGADGARRDEADEEKGVDEVVSPVAVEVLQALAELFDAVHELAQKESFEAEDRSALAGALVAVAAPLRALGRRRAAAPLLRLALDWRVRAGGRHHTAALLAAGNLAVLLQELGEVKEAEELYRRVAETKQRTYGSDDPSTLAAQDNLARFLRSTQRCQEAEDLSPVLLASSGLRPPSPEPSCAEGSCGEEAGKSSEGGRDVASLPALDFELMPLGSKADEGEAGGAPAAAPSLETTFAEATTSGKRAPESPLGSCWSSSTPSRLAPATPAPEAARAPPSADDAIAPVADASTDQASSTESPSVALGSAAVVAAAGATPEEGSERAEYSDGATELSTVLGSWRLGDGSIAAQASWERVPPSPPCEPIAFSPAVSTCPPASSTPGCGGPFVAAAAALRPAMTLQELARSLQGLGGPPASEERCADVPGMANRAAAALQAEGCRAEVESMFAVVVEVCATSLGPRHPVTLTCLNNFAVCLQGMGKHAAGEPLLREAFRAREEVLGPAHPDTLTCLNNLAMLLKARGRLEEAEPLLRRALAGCEFALGLEHPCTLLCLNNMAMLLQATGRQPEAEMHLATALQGSLAAFGPAHPDTATCFNNLGLLLKSVGKTAEAEALYRRALAAAEAAVGAEHPMALTPLSNLAALLQGLGRHGEAEPLLRQACAGRAAALGEEHPETLGALNNLAALFKATGRGEAAEPLLRMIVEVGGAALGPAHPHILTALATLASVLQEAGDVEEAERLMGRAAEGLRASLGAGHPDAEGARAAYAALREARAAAGAASRASPRTPPRRIAARPPPTADQRWRWGGQPPCRPAAQAAPWPPQPLAPQRQRQPKAASLPPPVGRPRGPPAAPADRHRPGARQRLPSLPCPARGAGGPPHSGAGIAGMVRLSA